jgi:MFS family permease
MKNDRILLWDQQFHQYCTHIKLPNMILRAQKFWKSYPRQFWLLMGGMLINTIGMMFIWPFLNIYLKTVLGIPVATATLLPMLEQGVSFFTTLAAGSVADRFGRKWLMALSLGAGSCIYLVMGFATRWWMFAILLGLRGFFLPLYRVAADTMVADLITDENERISAYALLRTVNNLGVAIGPVLGGFVAAVSYRASFLTAASTMLFFSLLVIVKMKETLPEVSKPIQQISNRATRSSRGAYRVVIRDPIFMIALLAFAFNGMGAVLPFQLLGIYGKENFGLSEAQLGLIVMVNALMVVFFQMPVSRITSKLESLKVLSCGALFYALGIISMAFGSQALHFAIGMAILTIGELLIAPTFISFAVNLAPEEMRGRYMSAYWVSWSVSRGIGPALAGQVYDSVAPSAIWYLGGMWNLLAAGIFASLAPAYRRSRRAKIPKKAVELLDSEP